MSWFRCEADGHERRVVFIRSHGLRLDVDTAMDDLRAYQDRVLHAIEEGRPWKAVSAGDFAERWGWSKTTAYRLIRDHKRWSDPSRLEAWNALWNDDGTRAERRRNDGGTTGHGSTGTTDETRNDGGTSAERTRNESGHTRGEIHTTHTPPAPEDEQQDAAPPRAPSGPPDTSFEEASAYLGEVVNRAVGRRPSKGPERSSKAGQALLKALRKDRARVLDAMRYVAEGEGDHAEFLRSRGTGLETILRHLDEYADRWRNPAKPQQRARGSPDRGSPGDGMFDEMLDERRGRPPTPDRDVIDAD